MDKNSAGNNTKDSGDIKKIAEAVQEAVIYPTSINIRDASGYSSGSRSGEAAGFSGGGSLTSVAQGAMRDLLGWRYREDDPKGFLAALNKAIDLKEVGDRTEWVWMPRPFMVQADLGAVTGAQASIYARAKVALEHALPLLDGLVPMRPDSDKEDNESMRSMVRFELNELVNELGRVGGPRIQRVGGYFTQLLGKESSQIDTEKVGGHLGDLATRFGLNRCQVLTVAEEQNLTNFLIMVDYTQSLFQTWEAQKDFFSRIKSGKDKFLGTQLVRLSQTLAVIVESVHEVYVVMDSVFFGAEERQVTVLKFSESTPSTKIEPITVADLLSWVEHFAAVEATQIIENSGKDGVKLVASMLDELRNLMEKVSGFKQSNINNKLPQAFFASRVTEALSSIAHYLTEAHAIADEIKDKDCEKKQSLAPTAT
ncbi:MAG: hypothetical protein HRU78_03680 [Gammaproteobacteria bacterium]|nr:MAG: hypothetical protein HRU78_03680 [Gammaproteobacteria bacterium]